jgi:hypothetical protein
LVTAAQRAHAAKRLTQVLLAAGCDLPVQRRAGPAAQGLNIALISA